MQQLKADPIPMAPSVEIVPQSDRRWLSFAADERPSLFQAPRWCELIEAEYGFPARVALALDSSIVIAGLPFAEIDDFHGTRRIAYPFSDFCEPLGDRSAWQAIEAALSVEGVPWQIRSRVMPSHAAQSVESPGVHQTIALPATMADVPATLHQKQRVNAQRLERAGGACRKVADAAFLEPFHSLFATLRKHKFRLLPQSKTFFERLAAAYFPDRGFALFAELNGDVLAGMILLAEGDTLYCKYSASDPAAYGLRPANALFQAAIQEAIALGYHHLDLGISIEPGLQRFKRHLGAQSCPYYVGRYKQKPKTVEAAELEAALATLTHILTEPDVPLSAAVDAGAALYRFFV